MLLLYDNLNLPKGMFTKFPNNILAQCKFLVVDCGRFRQALKFRSK